MALDNSTCTFDERLTALKNERGSAVSVDEVGDIISALVGSLEGDLSAVDFELHQGINELLTYINTAKCEIAAIQPNKLRETDIPEATDELDAVVRATEEATEKILDAAECLQEVVENVDAAAADRITDVITSIYEASNFQDITGQRITKVVAVLRYIEEKIGALADAVGHERDADQSGENYSEERDLLSGPQLPEDANSQDDIDALLASMD